MPFLPSIRNQVFLTTWIVKKIAEFSESENGQRTAKAIVDDAPCSCPLSFTSGERDSVRGRRTKDVDPPHPAFGSFSPEGKKEPLMTGSCVPAAAPLANRG
jgi:hypothetical protein